MSDHMKLIKDAVADGDQVFLIEDVEVLLARIEQLEAQCDSMLRVNEKIGEAYEKCCADNKRLRAVYEAADGYLCHTVEEYELREALAALGDDDD